MLATILSTPCTAPFLGTALGFAFVQSWPIALSLFVAIGLGMCLPYLILIIAPGYVRFLPKPGAWMEKLKEICGFVLLATVIWLISVLSYQISIQQLIAFVYFLLIVSFAIWLVKNFAALNSESRQTIAVRLLALLLVAGAAYFCFFQSDLASRPGTKLDTSQNSAVGGNEAGVEAFNLTRLNQALSSGKTVFLDFSAAWCLTCKVNENAVLNTAAVQNKLRSLHAIFIKADWTRQDPVVTKLLRKFDRSGVPFYVIFPGKDPAQPIVLPELLTEQIVISNLDQAGPSLSE